MIGQRLPWIRAVLTAMAVVLAVMSISRSMANFVVKIDPARAHGMWPENGKIAAILARSMAAAPDSGEGRRQALLARDALREDATQLDALVALAAQAQLRGDTAAARRLFGYSLQLSRRDLSSRAWGIEEAVDRGDVVGALNNYDVALRTSSRAQQLLFPVLSSAAGVPEVRTRLVELLGRKPPWTAEFMAFVAARGRDPSVSVALFDALEKVAVKPTAAQRNQVVTALFDSGKVDEAWDYFALSRLGTDRRRSRDPDFRQGKSDLTPFDWRTSNEFLLSADFSREGKRGLLEFNVGSGGGGILAEQNQLLPPGRYRVEGVSRGISLPAGSLLYWAVSCDGRELGRVLVPDSSAASGKFAGTIDVPPGCDRQDLQLIGRSSPTGEGFSGQILRVLVSPPLPGR